jgi:hypothetical protein
MCCVTGSTYEIVGSTCNQTRKLECGHHPIYLFFDVPEVILMKFIPRGFKKYKFIRFDENLE